MLVLQMLGTGLLALIAIELIFCLCRGDMMLALYTVLL